MKNTECKNEDVQKINALGLEAAKDANRLVIVRNSQDTLYVVVMDRSGKILEKKSLNVIDGIDYYKRLSDLETKNREDKKNSWDYSGKISDVRKGYFGKAVSEIAHMAVQYNAIIIMELISDRTKDKYFALGNNAFKTFEKMLVARLCDLHFGDVADGEPGSIINPYQLCKPEDQFTSATHNGIVFFVPARAARFTDPETGFFPAFSTASIHTKGAKVNWLSKFDKISMPAGSNALEVAFDYDYFSTYEKMPDKKSWTMKLDNPITVYDKEKKYTIYIEHPFAELRDALMAEGIDPENGILDALRANKVPGSIVDLMFNRINASLKGVVNSHDGERMMYVSPVNGRTADLSVNIAINLAKSFDEYLKKD